MFAETSTRIRLQVAHVFRINRRLAETVSILCARLMITTRTAIQCFDVFPIAHWRMAVLVCTRQFHYVPADVATEEGCSRLASEANRLMGGIDGLVSDRAMPFGG